ncbi:cyclodeaminase/cyclohydrolase family protein [Halomonas sp. PAMB 3232]|uniref:cyclodeaminase/cyclohydrolase family protein n=1 Tax=Halomonas sp. PAMB 3232 TaxID=3075221 RepID=UPI00289A260C|nr:cyclodeaminase/cyclohydrolase family protein [Halomonas sp. PAMB 3232]WNL38554.1 cyclodeaminase/cyclohydrolase family protein [Halomonas sp. PAMB 3232]
MTHDTAHDSIWQMPLDDFRDALALKPMPGCGAAAAVSASLGLALILKGLHLGQQHAQSDDRQALIDEGEALKQALSPLADEDVAAFEAMMDALKRPKRSFDEKAARREAIQAAASRAVQVPLDTARRCLEALTLGHQALSHIEAQFESDATAGAYLLHAAVQSVLLNVNANLEALGDEQTKQNARAAQNEIREQSRALIQGFEAPAS